MYFWLISYQQANLSDLGYRQNLSNLWQATVSTTNECFYEFLVGRAFGPYFLKIGIECNKGYQQMLSEYRDVFSSLN